MIFDQAWLTDLLELQQKAAEIHQGKDPAAGIQNLVAETLQQWGINCPPWGPDQDYFKSLRPKEAQNTPPASDWNVDIREAKDQIEVRTTIPGIAAESDLTIKLLQGKILHLSGKNSVYDDNGAAFDRKIPLPAEVTAVGGTARYHPNDLRIILPKKPVADEEIIQWSFAESQ